MLHGHSSNNTVSAFGEALVDDDSQLAWERWARRGLEEVLFVSVGRLVCRELSTQIVEIAASPRT